MKRIALEAAGLPHGLATTLVVRRERLSELSMPSFSLASSGSHHVTTAVRNDVTSLDTVLGFQLTFPVAVAYLLWLTDEKEIAQLNFILTLFHPAAVLHSVQRVSGEERKKPKVSKLK